VLGGGTERLEKYGKTNTARSGSPALLRILEVAPGAT
jgi:hypothetical protein